MKHQTLHKHFSTSFYIFAISVIIAIMSAEKAYFFWWLKDTYACSFLLIIELLYLNGRIRFKRNSFLIVISYILALSWMTNFTIVGYVGLFLEVLSVVLLMMLTKGEQKKLLSIITNVFAIFIGLSTFFYLLSFVIPMPSFGVIRNQAYEFNNHLFYVESTSTYGIKRFSAFFLEPGHLAVFCTFLLYANDFNFTKKQNIVFLVAIIVSFSLAGYILLPVGFLINSFINGKKNISLICFLVVIVGVFFFFSKYNNGDNRVNELIFSRLEKDEDKGIKGNNRNQLAVDFAFVSAFANGDIVKGYGMDEIIEKYSNAYGQLGAGYKVFLLSKGLIGAFSVFVLYLSLILKGENRKKSWGFFIIYIMAFLTQEYLLWFSWISIFILGTNSRLASSQKGILDHNL